MNKNSETHTIKIWTVIGDDMRRFGYQNPNLFFERPNRRTLGDLTECYCYEVAIPNKYHVAPNRADEMCLWDEKERLGCEVNKKETHLFVGPDSMNKCHRYPIRLVEDDEE